MSRPLFHRKPLAVFLTLALASAAIACWRSFSTMMPYDDEGTLMLSIQRFFDGQPLYDSVRSIYGPFYYFYEWLPHAITGGPVAHDTVRWVSSAWWVAAGLAIFLLIYRATGSLLLAAIAHLVGFRALAFIGLEASHPQEACILLLLAVPLAAAAIRRPLALWFTMGALAGAIALTKINLAIFVLAAIGVILAMGLPAGWLRRFSFPAVSAAALALPALLMSQHLGQGWAQKYAALIAISLASSLLAASKYKIEPPVSLRDAVFAGLGFLAAIGAISVFPLATGSTVGGMIESLIIWPRTHFSASWTHPLQVRDGALALAAICMGLAWAARRRYLPEVAIAILKLGSSLVTAAFVLRYYHHELVGVATPLFWLVAITPDEAGGGRRLTILRPLLAILGVIQVLYAYPVAGSQGQFVTVLMVVAGAINAQDALPWLTSRVPTLRSRGPAWAMALLVAAFYAHSIHSARAKYLAEPALDLPGARLVHADPAMTAAYRRIVQASQACSVLVSEPGIFSLNILSRRPVLRSLPAAGAWMLFLNDAEQRAAVDELRTEPRPCAVINDEMVEFWAPGRDVSQQPLVRYLHEDFHPVFEISGYRFLTR